MRIKGTTKLQHDRLMQFAAKFKVLAKDLKIRRQDGLIHAHIDRKSRIKTMPNLIFRYYLTIDSAGFGKEHQKILIEKKKASD